MYNVSRDKFLVSKVNIISLETIKFRAIVTVVVLIVYKIQIYENDHLNINTAKNY